MSFIAHGAVCQGHCQADEELVERPKDTDVSPKNDDRLGLQYGGALGVPRAERMGPMKRSKFSEEQVAYALRQAESGTAVGARGVGGSSHRGGGVSAPRPLVAWQTRRPLTRPPLSGPVGMFAVSPG